MPRPGKKAHYTRSPLTIITATLVMYFMFHIVSGDRGVLAMISSQNTLSELQTELDQLRAERIQLEHKVQLLRSDTLDPDLLEEIAREQFGLAHPNETVIIEGK